MENLNKYYTLLIPLTDEPGMGKTEVITPYHKSYKNGEIITPNVSIGDGLLFSGNLWHRGTANLSKKTRYCIYMIITDLPEEELVESWDE
jgi:ectoine hydroxylase-related dioxygenase (phytanoyl-CoA dioxygenase family)